MKKIKVLVVDDSALMRKIISDMINDEANMEVINTAKDGEDFLGKLQNAVPDVITLDVEMPKMDGITALRELKRRNIKIPIIMISSVTTKGAQITMECLEAGAFDFISKPSGAISLDINKVKEDLIQKINLAYEKTNKLPLYSETETKNSIAASKDTTSVIRKKVSGIVKAVVIGASTGGPKALYSVITKLPSNLGVPIFVVQHMPEGFTKAFAERLDINSNLKVVEAEDNMPIVNNTVYVAKGGYHMQVDSDKKIHLNKDPSIWG